MSIYIGDKEIKNLFVGESISISDMQGPCPDGFHVPKLNEYSAIQSAVNTLSSGMQSYRTYLKLPFNGCRLYTDGSVSYTGSQGWYWTSQLGRSNKASYVMFNSSSYYEDSVFTTYGCGIRPMKNTPSVPDLSWTVLFDGSSVASGAGVFWNQSAGLISVSSDGSTRYTIADKNLGATTVWNYGDTLTDANCGNFYQFGNNYGFPHSGSITTSSTTVDATGYGPGNYYNSTTFITGSYWDTSFNKNLRGGVSQGTTEEGAAKAVYIGENKVRPSTDTRTFTISRTEQSNMSSGWTYSDDAAGLTAGDTAFDEFFGYYGCRLNTSGVETAKVTQEESGGAGKLDITKLGTLTSGDNVMIAFPVMGIKMSKSGSTVTLSITKELNKDGYQYYAHSTGTLSNPGTPKDVFYLGAYKGYSSSSVIKSWSGQSPTGSQTQATFITRAKANGSGYNIEGFYQRMYINALYMMKYGNPNSQSVVGTGYNGYSSSTTTGGTNSQTNATYGTTSAVQIKLFGLEDRWGNVDERLGGAYTDNSKVLYTMLTGWTGATSGGISTGTTITQTSTYNGLSSIAGNNKAMFAPTATVNGSSTYYMDDVYVGTSSIAQAGGARNSRVNVGAFRLYIGVASASSSTGSRLMYLNGLT